MRSAKDTDCFPYSSKRVCYILVENNGNVKQLSLNKSEKDKNLEAARLVDNGEAKIYAVWPGNWRSDLFIIDDINKFIGQCY